MNVKFGTVDGDRKVGESAIDIAISRNRYKHYRVMNKCKPYLTSSRPVCVNYLHLTKAY